MKIVSMLSALLLVGFVGQAQASMEKKSTSAKVRHHPQHVHHENQDEQLVHAVESGHVARARELVAHGARLNRFQREMLERRQANFALALATADEPRRNGADHMGHGYRSKVTDQFHHRASANKTARKAAIK